MMMFILRGLYTNLCLAIVYQLPCITVIVHCLRETCFDCCVRVIISVILCFASVVWLLVLLF